MSEVNDDIKKRVLIVEDDQELVTMLRKAIEDAGFEVVSAENGLIGKADVLRDAPNLMLLDINMPQMNGISLIRELHKEGKLPPTILLTSVNDSDLIADAAEHGVTEYLVKSDWEIDEVVARVKDRLDKRR